MSGSTYDREFWEHLWQRTLRERGVHVAARPPSPHLAAATAGLTPGRALDAGCGHGADALALAAQGWRVSAVDFSVAALAHARATAELAGSDIAARMRWIEADLGSWQPEPAGFDLVISLYVHVAGDVAEMVRRLAAGVDAGGTLFLVGHRPHDPTTGRATAAAGQRQISVESAVAALDPNRWRVDVAEERERPSSGSGVDAVICAVKFG